MAEPGTIYLKASSIAVQDGTGATVKVNGSPAVNRDLSDKQNWWKLRPVRELPPRQLDENGVPYRFCSGGHDRPVRAFSKDARRTDGLDPYCKECRHEQYMARSQEAAARAGKALRRYRERKAG